MLQVIVLIIGTSSITSSTGSNQTTQGRESMQTWQEIVMHHS
jgi:hypothetical protein